MIFTAIFATSPAACAQDIAITGATLIDGNRGSALPDSVILISGQRIAAIGPRSSLHIPAGAKMIDAAGRYIVPGFIDTNVHLSLYGGSRDRYETLAKYNSRQDEIVLELHRDWAPEGVDHFYNLVRAGYYDDDHVFRVIKGRWAQFGINGDPKIGKLWRGRKIMDDSRRESNVRGTIAYAFAVPNGRTTQLFIKLQDNTASHDKEPFVPIGKVIQGMDVADSLFAEYGEASGGGIRAGKQDALFDEGNAYLERNFPRLDWIERATLVER